MEEEGNPRKRIRTDTFWHYSDAENGQYFDDIHEGRNSHYYLVFDEVTKLDGKGKERLCWRTYSRKTNRPADSIRSTKPYRLALLWSVHAIDDYWSSAEKKRRVMSQLPEIAGKRGDHCRHRCGNDWCCNPSHITIGSRQDNETDKHFHYFTNHPDQDVRERFVKAFPDLMVKQGVW
jgi:hypothetical protein